MKLSLRGRGISDIMGENQKEKPSSGTNAMDAAHRLSIDEILAKIAAWARRYAEKNGWVLNPDEQERTTVLHGLASNREQFGKQYCPCRLRSGDLENDKKIICPCIYHRDEIAKDSHCHCRLFFKEDATPAREVSE